MIRDIVRACLAVAAMAVAAALVVQVRYELAAIDVAHRAAIAPANHVAAGQPAHGQPAHGQPAHGQPAAGQPGPLRRLGRATLDLADAALNVVR
jgi:hypothetical protein